MARPGWGWGGVGRCGKGFGFRPKGGEKPLEHYKQVGDNMLWIELGSLPERHTGVLTPSVSECDVIWREGLYRGNPVKTRS